MIQRQFDNSITRCDPFFSVERNHYKSKKVTNGKDPINSQCVLSCQTCCFLKYCLCFNILNRINSENLENLWIWLIIHLVASQILPKYCEISNHRREKERDNKEICESSVILGSIETSIYTLMKPIKMDETYEWKIFWKSNNFLK